MEKQPDFNPADLPQEAMKRKEVFQHPQTADTGKPLDKEAKTNPDLAGKESQRSSKEEGMNESREGAAGNSNDGPDGQS